MNSVCGRYFYYYDGRHSVMSPPDCGRAGSGVEPDPFGGGRAVDFEETRRRRRATVVAVVVSDLSRSRGRRRGRDRSRESK